MAINGNHQLSLADITATMDRLSISIAKLQENIKALMHEQHEEPKENIHFRESLFHTRWKIKGKVCGVMISNGSFTNVASTRLVEKLGFETSNHPKPYKLKWLNNIEEFQVTKQAKIPFSIGKHYVDMVLCDIIPMDDGELLLGRPWQYDRDAMYDGRKNTYSIVTDKKRITFLPLSLEAVKRDQTLKFERAKETTSQFVTQEEILKALKNGPNFCTLLSTELNGSSPTVLEHEDVQPKAIVLDCAASHTISNQDKVEHVYVTDETKEVDRSNKFVDVDVTDGINTIKELIEQDESEIALERKPEDVSHEVQAKEDLLVDFIFSEEIFSTNFQISLCSYILTKGLNCHHDHLRELLLLQHFKLRGRVFTNKRNLIHRYLTSHLKDADLRTNPFQLGENDVNPNPNIPA